MTEAFITLTKGKKTLIDSDKLNYLNNFKWFVSRNQSGKYYARTSTAINKKRKKVSMHRLLLGIALCKCKEYQGDHVNGDSLDNRLCNLRIVSPADNGRNRHENTATGYVGVSFDKGRPRPYRSRVMYKNEEYYLGRFKTKEEAKKVYEKALENICNGKGPYGLGRS